MLLVLSGLAGACGPIGYVNQVTRKASASVEAARAARAEALSPYWYTLAVEYLHKAREEASYADYEAANRFGRKAQEAADKAREQALARAANSADTSWLPPDPLRQKDDVESTSLAPADASGGLAPVIADPADKKKPKASPPDRSRPKTKTKTKPKPKAAASSKKQDSK